MFESPINGVLFFIFLAAVPLAFALSLIIRPLYRRAVLRAMNSTSAHLTDSFAVPKGARLETRQLEIECIDHNIRPKVRMALGIRYLIAGMAHGAVATLIYFLLEGIDFAPRRFVIVWMILSWPALPLALHVMGLTRWVITGAAALSVGVLMLFEPGATFLIAWLVGPAVLAALVIANRVFRTTAITLYLIAITLILPLLFALDLALVLVPLFNGLALWISVAALGTLGCLLALLLARVIGNVTRTSSDLMIQSDVLWLMVTLWQITHFSGTHGIAALLPFLSFAAYRLVLFVCSFITVSQPCEIMLFLRVFGQQRNQEKLSFGMLTERRIRGPVFLIGGPDLAIETLDPAELSAFLNHSMEDLFISAPDKLAAITSQDHAPAHDGLFPVLDYYCTDNAWRPTVTTLMNMASHVVLDLRGLSAENSGVRYEINEVIKHIEPAQIEVLVDDATDVALAKQLFDDSWQHAFPEEKSGIAKIRFFDIS